MEMTKIIVVFSFFEHFDHAKCSKYSKWRVFEASLKIGGDNGNDDNGAYVWIVHAQVEFFSKGITMKSNEKRGTYADIHIMCA